MAREQGFAAAGVRFYYGNAPEHIAAVARDLGAGQILVVEASVLEGADKKLLLGRAEAVGAKVLAYLSAGEIGPNDLKGRSVPEFLAAHGIADGVTLGANTAWGSTYVNATPEWSRYVLGAAAAVCREGFHGVFLDTVDTVDVYIGKPDWDYVKKRRAVEGMIALIRAVKAGNPDKFVMINRGLNFLDRTVNGLPATAGLDMRSRRADNPDAVLWENAYVSEDDPWVKWATGVLKTLSLSKAAQVFYLGYADAHPSAERFFERCAADGVVGAWAPSRSLAAQPTSVV